MKLPETIEKQTAESGSIAGFVKLYAHGKLGLLFHGDNRFTGIAEKCFAEAVQVLLTFDRKKFETEMRRHGVPDEAIRKYAEGFCLHDDVWLSKGNGWPQ
ncbi:MAG: hypothetical protein PVF56_22965 [Desulfobacterales bacterium]|jgi:hypothetical protein